MRFFIRSIENFVSTLKGASRKDFLRILIIIFCFAVIGINAINLFRIFSFSNNRALAAANYNDKPSAAVSAFLDETKTLSAKVKYRNYSPPLSESEHFPLAGKPRSVAENTIIAAQFTDIPTEDLPPLITVRARASTKEGAAAIIDIDDDYGVVAVVGYKFLGGKGRVTAIDEEGVSWTWNGKKLRSNLQ